MSALLRQNSCCKSCGGDFSALILAWHQAARSPRNTRLCSVKPLSGLAGAGPNCHTKHCPFTLSKAETETESFKMFLTCRTAANGKNQMLVVVVTLLRAVAAYYRFKLGSAVAATFLCHRHRCSCFTATSNLSPDRPTPLFFLLLFLRGVARARRACVIVFITWSHSRPSPQ